MLEESKCDVCQKIATQRCGGCHEIFYCGREHQKIGWKNHKKCCRPFKIETDDVLGRHLVATRDIKPNEIILKESPLIWGPTQITIPVCLGCGKGLTEKNQRPCSTCGWPMCSEICEKAPGHIPECRYTVMRGDKVTIRNFHIIHPSYQCITVLRCLYQKQFLPAIWKKIISLQSHCEQRKHTHKYEEEKTTIAQFIRKFFKLENIFSEDEIMKICGVVMVNSHEVPVTEPAHIAIYETTSMFEHNCSANCTKSFTNAGGVIISSGSNIKKGEHLSICYTDPLWGTPSRRQHLNESKFFWCSCNRCEDVTEFGTYFSALRCQDSNCKGFLLPKTFLDNTYNGKGADWRCNICHLVLDSYAVHDTLERIGKDLADMPKGISSECVKFIKTYEELLHKNHYYLTDVKLALLQLIGEEHDGGLAKVTDDDLELKVQLCQNLSNLIKKLLPGEKRLRGLILFELHAAYAELGRRRLDRHILHPALLESRNILLECTELLKNEPSILPEGKIYKQAVANLKELDVVLSTVHGTLNDFPIG